ncbi:MAG: hypothetical protein H0U49_11210 [Parachlamydiaceae bacterium]|nr:hypothetical protein [Parachlamydiaceae bacterium]
MNDYNSRILDNIYWAVGAITTVIFIVLGLGYYNNKRNMEELKQDIKISLRQEILSELSRTASEEIQKIKSNELSDIKQMKYNFVKMEVENWKAKGVYPNVLSTALDLLKIAQESESKYDILEQYLRQKDI